MCHGWNQVAVGVSANKSWFLALMWQTQQFLRPSMLVGNGPIPPGLWQSVHDLPGYVWCGRGRPIVGVVRC